jgi:hypothetical protein
MPAPALLAKAEEPRVNSAPSEGGKPLALTKERSSGANIGRAGNPSLASALSGHATQQRSTGMTMNDNDRRRTTVRNEGMGWGIPALIVAAIVIIGGLFYMNSSGSGTSTASNNSTPKTATTTNSGPVSPGAPAPGPTTTTPAPNR